MGQNILGKAKPTWRELYQAALAEVDSGEVRRKIDLACTAILQRINALAEARDLWAVEEQREILESREIDVVAALHFGIIGGVVDEHIDPGFSGGNAVRYPLHFRQT